MNDVIAFFLIIGAVILGAMASETMKGAVCKMAEILFNGMRK
jgi:hypothetical protein